MRIGMMADLYKPHVSGVTNYIDLNKRELQARGHEVFVLTFGEAVEEDGPRVLRSPGVPLPLTDSGLNLTFRHSARVQDALGRMDVVHVHHPFLSGRLALRYCRPAGIPLVFTAHTRYELYARAYLPMLPDPIGSGLLQAYLPPFCREMDLVIAPSPGVKCAMRQLGVRGPIEIVPNGVRLAPFRPPPDRSLRAELGIPGDHLTLIYTGRLGPEKNLFFLLRAFGGANEACPGSTLVLVGRGGEQDNLREYARRLGLPDRIKFTGFVPYDRLPGYLRMADAFVTASVTEGHPLSVIEALAAGLPVVGVDSPGVADIVIHGHNGLLAANELPAFTAALTRLLADGETRRRLAEGAVTSAGTYDIRRTAPLMEAHYRRLAGNVKPASAPPTDRSRWGPGATTR